ncbi:hypothetical protein ACYOEI_13020, partial [Singulisphaera rosea]
AVLDDGAWGRRAHPSDETVGETAVTNPKATEGHPTPIAARFRGLLVSACFEDRPSHQLSIGKIG